MSDSRSTITDKAIIIIAVSKYNGSYGNLPGAVNSARKIREWAESENYSILYLTDEDGSGRDRIDVALVRKEVNDFISNNYIERLIVYFAGHGIARSGSSEFWLLTDAANNITEGINIQQFQDGLLTCNFGSETVPGQVCLIGDACRNAGRDAIRFDGDPIITSNARINNKIKLDRFFATSLGSYAFQINDGSDENSYCLFSELLIRGLNGEIPDAIDTTNHPFKPAVINERLADYLDSEVTIQAAEIGQEMTPDTVTGIRSPYNFYKIIERSESDSTRNPVPPPAAQVPLPTAAQAPLPPRPHSQTLKTPITFKRRIDNSNIQDPSEQLTEREKSQKETLLQWMQLAENTGNGLHKLIAYGYQSNRYCTFSDFRPKKLAIPNNTQIQLVEVGELYQIEVVSDRDLPILISQGDEWLITPNFPNVANIISRNLPGDILLFNYRANGRNEQRLDTYLSDFSNLIDDNPLLRAADVLEIADSIRVGKEEFPHQAVMAGYLYQLAGDYDNIARTAHYMAVSGILPFELAVLCADKVWWSEENGRTVAYADLPAVEADRATERDRNRPSYTKRSFEECKNVRLWGIVPVFSRGWNFMQTAGYLDIREDILQIAKSLGGRSAASLTKQGQEKFLEVFDYQIIDP